MLQLLTDGHVLVQDRLVLGIEQEVSTEGCGQLLLFDLRQDVVHGHVDSSVLLDADRLLFSRFGIEAEKLHLGNVDEMGADQREEPTIDEVLPLSDQGAQPDVTVGDQEVFLVAFRQRLVVRAARQVGVTWQLLW